MGKEGSGKSTRSYRRESPVESALLKDLDLNVSALPLVEKLSSDQGKTRQKACTMIGIALFNPTFCTRFVQQHDGINKLFQRFTDINLPVVAAATKALRNLSTVEKDTILNTLSSPDNLKKYLDLYQKVLTCKDNKGELHHVYNIITELFGILWNLCVFSENVTNFTITNFLTDVFGYFRTDADFPDELIVTSGHLLSAVSDENPVAAQVLWKIEGSFPKLLKLAKNPAENNSLVSILASVILFNMRQKENPFSIVQAIFPTLLHPIHNFVPLNIINSLITQLTANEQVRAEKAFVNELNKSRDQIESQVASLELITNIFSIDEDSMNAEDLINSVKPFAKQISLQKLLELAVPPTPELNDKLTMYEGIFIEFPDYLADLNCRAFSTIINLFSIITPSEINTTNAEIWSKLKEIAGVIGISPDTIKQSEGIISVVRSFLCGCSSFEFLPPESLNDFIGLSNNIFSAEIRSCGISILVALADKSIPQDVGQILLNKLNDESMIVINDALNGIFDIFGKDENNEICAKLNVTKALAAQQQSLTRRVSQQKNILGNRIYETSQETLENLAAFIDYKRSINN